MKDNIIQNVYNAYTKSFYLDYINCTHQSELTLYSEYITATKPTSKAFFS